MLTPGKLYRTLDALYASSDEKWATKKLRLWFSDSDRDFGARENAVLPSGSVVFFLGYHKLRMLKVLIGEEVKYIVPTNMYQPETFLFPLHLPKANPMIKRFAAHVRKNMPQQNSVSALLFPFPEPNF